MDDDFGMEEARQKQSLLFPQCIEGRSEPTAEELRGVFEGLRIGVLFVDPDLRSTSANGTAGQLLNLESGALLARPLTELLPERFSRVLREKASLAMESKVEVCFDAWCPHPVGRWLHCRCLPAHDGAVVLLEDASARKGENGRSRGRAQPARNGSQELDAVYGAVPLGLCLLDAGGRFVRVNDRLAGMVEIPADELVGRTVRQAMPCIADNAEEALREVMRTGCPRFDVTLTRMALDNPEVVTILVGRFSPLTDASGKVSGVSMVVEEVNRRMRAYQATAVPDESHKAPVAHRERVAGSRRRGEPAERRSGEPTAGRPDTKSLSYHSITEVLDAVPEVCKAGNGQCSSLSEIRLREILQALVNSVPVMLVFYDTQHHAVMTNREFTRLTGWSVDTSGSLNFLTAILPDLKYRRDTWDFLTSGQGIWREIGITTRSGEVLSSSWMSMNISGDYVLGIGIDLRLCNLCRQIGDDLVKFAGAVEQAGEGIALLSSSGVIEYINPALEAITGYRRDEVTGSTFDSFSDYLLGDRREEICKKVAAGNGSWSACRKRRRKTGEVYEASMSISPVRDTRGRIIDYVAIIRDVTRESMLHRQLSHVQKMEALGTLAGGIAHDLKNIFSPISLDVETLMQDVGVQDRLYPVLDEIQQATRMGVDLVNQILTFSRNTPHVLEPVELYPVVRKFLSFLRAALPPTIDISHNLHARGGLVMADSTRIQQVLMNLATNARHAMREKGGVLTVGLSQVSLDEKAATELSPGLKPGPYLELMIGDTGEGMPAERLQRIFDPFFTTKKPGEGTGLGLAVVHGIVQEHRGAISVTSESGRGSVFRVYLPRLNAEGTAGENPGPKG